MAHTIPVRVYYEDTDLAGIVYYANYLRYFERARTEALREYGIDQARLKAEAGLVFAVRRCLVEYLVPARMDDLLEVTVAVSRLRGASAEMVQEVRRQDTGGATVLTRAEVTIACLELGTTGIARAVRFPAEIRAILAQLARES